MVVVGEKFVFFEAYEEVGVARSHSGPKPDLYKRYIDDCVGATSSSREEVNLFINSDNSFHPALKYSWEISENSLDFLDIKLSINDNGLSTICGLSSHHGNTESRKNLEQKFIFQLGALSPHGINERLKRRQFLS